jgi:hypothetical protein
LDCQKLFFALPFSILTHPKEYFIYLCKAYQLVIHKIEVKGMNILDTIVKRKQEEVSYKKSRAGEKELIKTSGFERKCFNLSEFLKDAQFSGIIAEFKRKSPSKPTINLLADVNEITIGYTQNGASALSVLTDADFFGGSDSDLIQARDNNQIPILRKDFVIDPYQILEAKSIGADAILLIAEILTKNQVNELSKVAKDNLKRTVKLRLMDLEETSTLNGKQINDIVEKKVSREIGAMPIVEKSDKFIVGKTYINSTGKKAVYNGNGQWEEK